MEAVERLSDLKERIEESKTKKAQAEGRLQGHMDTLKTDHGVSSVKKAQAKMEKLDDESETLDEELKKGMAEIDDLLEAYDESS